MSNTNLTEKNTTEINCIDIQQLVDDKDKKALANGKTTKLKIVDGQIPPQDVFRQVQADSYSIGEDGIRKTMDQKEVIGKSSDSLENIKQKHERDKKFRGAVLGRNQTER